MKFGNVLHDLMGQKALSKNITAMILGALTLYYLHTGRRDGDFGRLVWAAVLAIGSLMVLSL